MDDAEQPPPKSAKPRPPSPTMEELRARFGRALRDQNFWHLMNELEEQQPPEETPPTVVPFPSERVEETPAKPPGPPGQLITGRFPKKTP